MRSDNLVLSSIEKVKPVFLTFPYDRTVQNPDLTAFTSKIPVFCGPE